MGEGYVGSGVESGQTQLTGIGPLPFLFIPCTHLDVVRDAQGELGVAVPVLEHEARLLG